MLKNHRGPPEPGKACGTVSRFALWSLKFLLTLIIGRWVSRGLQSFFLRNATLYSNLWKALNCSSRAFKNR